MNAPLDAPSTNIASRVDPALAIRDEAEFFGPARERLFGFRHTPMGEPTSGVLICSSLFAEFRKNYRREVELGRSLAGIGFAVQRFHYRGTGNSDGRASAVTLDTLAEDALSAGARLTAATGAPIRAVVGTRLGALVAASVADQLRLEGIVLWEPVTDAATYFRDAFRAHRVSQMREQGRSPISRLAPTEELASRGQVEVLGYTIHRPLYESMLAAVGDRDAADPPRRVLLVQVSPKARPVASLAHIERWRELGSTVDMHNLEGEEPWWLAGQEDLGSDGSRVLAGTVGFTRGWLRDVLGSEDGS